MRYRLAIEEIEPGHWLAWVLDLPGCYSAAATQAAAIDQAPASIARYHACLAEHDSSLAVPNGPIETEVAETFAAFASARDPEYRVNAFFEDDRRPLGYWDVVVAQRLLDRSRAAFLRALDGLGDQQLQRAQPGTASDSIAGIVAHVAGAENWYVWRLGLGLPRASPPAPPLRRLEAVRENAKRQLWTLIGDTRIVEHYDEHWSARKLVRRALWHESDHRQQIERLRANLDSH
jgi:predicted RNase H-like HicB family nuclease